MSTTDTNLVTVDTDDGQAITVHPVTGEAVNVATAAPEDIAEHLEKLDDTLHAINQFRSALEAELVARVDRTGGRTAWIGPLKLEVNTPTSENYRRDDLERALRDLVDEGILDEAAIDRVIVQPERPPLPPRKIDKRAVNTLKRAGRPEIIAAIASARDVVPARRTVKILERATDSEATD